MSVGDTVQTKFGPGQVRFEGTTQFAPGTWIGVELRTADGKNDGSVAGVRYFDCRPGYGVFLRPSALLPTAPQSSGSSGSSAAKFEHLRSDFIQLQKEYKDLQRTVQQLEEQLESTALDKEVAEETCELQSTEIESLQTQLLALESQLNTRFDADGADISKLQIALVTLRDELQRTTTDYQQVEADLAQAKSSLNALQLENSAIKDKLAAVDEANQELVAQADAVRDSSAIIDDLSAKNASMLAQIEALQASVSELEELRELNEQLDADHAATESSLRQEISSLQVEVTESRNAVEKLVQSIKERDDTIKKQKDLIVQLKAAAASQDSSISTVKTSSVDEITMRQIKVLEKRVAVVKEATALLKKSLELHNAHVDLVLPLVPEEFRSLYLSAALQFKFDYLAKTLRSLLKMVILYRNEQQSAEVVGDLAYLYLGMKVCSQTMSDSAVLEERLALLDREVTLFQSVLCEYTDENSIFPPTLANLRKIVDEVDKENVLGGFAATKTAFEKLYKYEETSILIQFIEKMENNYGLPSGIAVGANKQLLEDLVPIQTAGPLLRSEISNAQKELQAENDRKTMIETKNQKISSELINQEKKVRDLEFQLSALKERGKAYEDIQDKVEHLEQQIADQRAELVESQKEKEVMAKQMQDMMRQQEEDAAKLAEELRADAKPLEENQELKEWIGSLEQAIRVLGRNSTTHLAEETASKLKINTDRVSRSLSDDETNQLQRFKALRIAHKVMASLVCVSPPSKVRKRKRMGLEYESLNRGSMVDDIHKRPRPQYYSGAAAVVPIAMENASGMALKWMAINRVLRPFRVQVGTSSEDCTDTCVRRISDLFNDNDNNENCKVSAILFEGPILARYRAQLSKTSEELRRICRTAVVSSNAFADWCLPDVLLVHDSSVAELRSSLGVLDPLGGGKLAVDSVVILDHRNPDSQRYTGAAAVH
ncbi:hypothetical protein CANCADRAFT_4555 [Tortispora caseinolytica NRRL Y-17796]|uniref:CAP-Gly domain-containing protein n=1 Tax=Tortispora caseinolytica NRRL Y-17796 TaxID=767744 RepID=A0A1E4T9U0_9ASCO|nr:hypothetical protein CANCADRAFT_4555 [Tortispora caseinolytica NRRL Y-17796]